MHTYPRYIELTQISDYGGPDADGDIEILGTVQWRIRTDVVYGWFEKNNVVWLQCMVPGENDVQIQPVMESLATVDAKFQNRGMV